MALIIYWKIVFFTLLKCKIIVHGTVRKMREKIAYRNLAKLYDYACGATYSLDLFSDRQ